MVKSIILKYKKLSVQVKASIWFVFSAFLQRGISVITTPIFTRLLNTAEYGQYSVFVSWMGIATVFVNLNLSAGVYNQGLVKFSNDRAVFSSSLQGLSTLLLFIWTLIYAMFYSYWNRLLSLTTVQVLAMLLLIWTSAAFNFWAVEQRTQYKYRLLVTITLVVSVLKPVTGIIFVLIAEDKVTARIIGLLIVELVGYIGLYFAQIFRGKKLFHKKYWKHALLFNLPLVPHYLSQTVLNSADRIMICEMVSDSAGGIYSLAYSVSSIMTIFNGALMQTMSPWIYIKIKEHKISEISNVAYGTLILIAMVNICLISFAPEVISIFAPKEYYEAIWVIPPVAMSVYFMYAYDLFAKFAFYYEKTSMVMLASVAGAVLNVVLNYIFIDAFGYLTAGYTTLVCYIVYCVGHYLFMNRICNQYCGGEYPYNKKIILGITSVFLLIGFLLMATYSNRIIRYSAIFALFVVAALKKNKIVAVLHQVLSVKKK